MTDDDDYDYVDDGDDSDEHKMNNTHKKTSGDSLKQSIDFILHYNIIWHVHDYFYYQYSLLCVHRRYTCMRAIAIIAYNNNKINVPSPSIVISYRYDRFFFLKSQYCA